MSKFGIVNQNTGNKTQFFTDFVRKKKNHAPDRSGIPRHDSYRDGDTADSGLRRQKINNNSILLDYQLFYDAQQPPAYNGEQVSAGQNYNGNINGIAVNYQFAAQSGLTNFNEPTIYGYTYDQLNRLVQADGLVGDFVANSGGQTQQSYLIGDESYSFDRIGNLKTLQRYLRNTASGPVSSLEGFTYNYQAGSNRLTGVNAQAGGTDRAYSFDANGNALTDSYKKISQTDYGRAAYAYRQVVDGSELLYLYDVGDARIYKSSTKNGITKQEYYLKDAGGKDVAVYDYGTSSWNLQVYGAELVARISGGTGAISAAQSIFFLYDHLGNTRVSYHPADATHATDIQYAADYFPYGKILREFANGAIEKYLTTGHERDQETGLDYRGARYYDSDIARFLSLDPMASKYPSLSPYNYVGGNPVMLVDPTGKEIEPTRWTKDHLRLLEAFGDPNGFSELIKSKFQNKPSWKDMYNNYPRTHDGQDDRKSASVFKMVFGNLYDPVTKTLNIPEKPDMSNGCATRLSVALVRCGINLPGDFLGQVGEFEGKGIITNAERMKKALTNTVFGEPTNTFDMSTLSFTDVQNTLSGKKGIYIMLAADPATFEATGHVSLWTGKDVVGKHNYAQSAGFIYFWELKQ